MTRYKQWNQYGNKLSAMVVIDCEKGHYGLIKSRKVSVAKFRANCKVIIFQLFIIIVYSKQPVNKDTDMIFFISCVSIKGHPTAYSQLGYLKASVTRKNPFPLVRVYEIMIISN